MTPEKVKALQDLIQSDVDLQGKLKALTSTTEAAELISQAAAKNDLQIDTAELNQHFAEAKTKAANMSDKELESIAGGAGSAGIRVVQGGWDYGNFFDPMLGGIKVGTADVTEGKATRLSAKNSFV